MIKLLYFYYCFIIEKNAEFVNVECVSEKSSKFQTNKKIVIILIEYTKNNIWNKMYILIYKILTKKACYLKILNKKKQHSVEHVNLLIDKLFKNNY